MQSEVLPVIDTVGAGDALAETVTGAEAADMQPFALVTCTV